MTIVLGPTWAYVQHDKLLMLCHASVGVGGGGHYLAPDIVLRDR